MQRTPWISLVTLNASFQHCAFGLRYLKANLAELEPACLIQEFTTRLSADHVVEKILSEKPLVVGFGIYIWNTTQTQEVIRLLAEKDPAVIIVCGGPEVSFETETQPFYELADFLVCGEGEQIFLDLCRQIRDGVRGKKGQDSSAATVLRGMLPDIQTVKMPYALYSDEDLRNRTIYVEASRGCPYKCEYCLSSLDQEVRAFPLETFLEQMDGLIQRGVRGLKFVDRTFNLSPKVSQRILQFFLDRLQYPIFLHFEMVPDRLPQELRALIQQFPEGRLQFEIGIQTWDSRVAALVSRRQNYDRIRENLVYLRTQTQVHIHADLIVGLPGETLQSFAEGFDQLYKLNPHEIQVGLLKRLKGTPIVRHDEKFGMKYSAIPPFTVLQTSTLSSNEINRLNSFAKWWDLIANSGRFTHWMGWVRELDPKSPFAFFSSVFADLEGLFLGQKPAPAALTGSLFECSLGAAHSEQPAADSEVFKTEVLRALRLDYIASGNTDRPKKIFSKLQLGSVADANRAIEKNRCNVSTVPVRQARHRRSDLN
jgi:radical SAM superfamily enzyme YgiQ (UPF0313 family)